MTTPHTEEEKLREAFKKELCWQDTDGKWFLNGTPNTVPDLLDWFLSHRRDLLEKIEGEIGGDIENSITLPTDPQWGEAIIQHINQERTKFRSIINKYKQ